MIDQRTAILAQRRFGHPTQFAPLDLGGGALVGGIVVADRHDSVVLDLDAQRLVGIGGKHVEHPAAERQFPRLVDALVGDVAKPGQRLEQGRQVARRADRDLRWLGVESGRGRIGARECLSRGDQCDARALRLA